MPVFDDIRDVLGAGAEKIRGRLTPNADLSAVTWFRTGGPAQLMFQPADEEDLALFLALLPAEIPLTVMGLGSNLLVRDGGIRGVVVRLGAKGFGQTVCSGDLLTVGAAVPDKKFAAEALKAGLTGFEFYHGIPGAIGGALRMNAGAHGTETGDHFVSARAVSRTGELVTPDHDAMGFSYRTIAAPSDLVFTQAVFKGTPADAATIQDNMDAVQRHREEAQPIRSRTGGSTFRNPEGNSAWKVVDAAGCRGLQIGGAQVSEMHCNFLLNLGGATAHDIETLGETVRARALQKSGIALDWEIKRLGEFKDGQSVLPFLGEK